MANKSTTKGSQTPLSNHMIHVVEPGFNAVGIKEDEQDLKAPATLQMFDKPTQQLLESNKTFTLVLGQGFEEPSGLFSFNPCKNLHSVEQLRFLKEHGLQRIVMARLHGTLVQNARALGIETIVGGY